MLLYKTPCVTHWASHFESSIGRASGTRVNVYPWSLCRDAASADVDLLSRNPLAVHAGVMYNKAYNVHKVLWDTPLKGHRLFGLSLLETLAYSAPLFEDWLKAHQRRSAHAVGSQPATRSELIRAFERCKTRLRAALTPSLRFDIGVR